MWGRLQWGIHDIVHDAKRTKWKISNPQMTIGTDTKPNEIF